MCGINTVAFFPNKDVFYDKVESEVMGVIYPEKTLFVASQNKRITGFVSCQIDDEYKSYAMNCPTFGWLRAQNLETCKALMNECEKFVRENKKKKLRGPFIQNYEIILLVKSKN